MLLASSAVVMPAARSGWLSSGSVISPEEGISTSLKYSPSGTPLRRTVILSPAFIVTLFVPEPPLIAAGPGEEGRVLVPPSPPQPLNRTQANTTRASEPARQVSFFMNLEFVALQSSLAGHDGNRLAVTLGDILAFLL